MDLNGDGHPDILSGSYSRMDKDMAGLFQVLWGKEGGDFAVAEALKGTDGKPLIVVSQGARDDDLPRICTRPYAIDWDGDGHLDVITGNFEGSFYLFKGEGGGKFEPKASKLRQGSGESPLVVPGNHSDPFVVDWDGDGDLDLLSGSGGGGVYWAENTNAKGQTPGLKDFVALISPPRNIQDMLPKGALPETPGRSTRVWADDVNGDGKLDLVVGDSVTLAYQAKGLSDEEFAALSKAWEETREDLQKKAQAQNEDQKASREAMKNWQSHYQKRSEFIDEQRTGMVWIYRQK